MLEIDANMMFTFSASGDTPILRCIVSGLQNIGFWPLVIIPIFHHSNIPWDDIEHKSQRHTRIDRKETQCICSFFKHYR